MKELLQSLHHQTFIFNTQQPIDALPEMAPFKTILIDANTFELRMENDLCLNEVFAVLTKLNINIQSMRNKTNRLEELFLDLIKNGN